MKEKEKVCSWCLKEQDIKIVYDPNNLVSHGMCKRHYEAEMKKHEAEAAEEEIKEAA